MEGGLAKLHVAYGVVAGAISALMMFLLASSPDSVGGCCGQSFAPGFLTLFGLVFVLAVPQILAARSYLRGNRNGRLWMALLAGLNLCVNLGTVGLVLAGGGGVWAGMWLPFLVVNGLTLAVFARGTAELPGDARPSV